MHRHRMKDKDFTRKRSLLFPIVLLTILRKGVKSLQNTLNELFGNACPNTVTASAYSQAREKLRHTAFIELNREAVVANMYAKEDFRTYWGFRLLAIDGSKLILPNTAEIRDEFGTIPYTNGYDTEKLSEHPYGLASVLYDVLNRVALDATLARSDAYEVDLAINHLQQTRSGDLLLMDRNYPSYKLLATLVSQQRDFVIRCSAASFATARQMLQGEGESSQIVTLTRPNGKKTLCMEQGLPLSIRVRFVRVRLSTGEWEVLVTSLLDEERYKTDDFLQLYGLRWGIETFYGLLKTRLGLENFSGKGVQAVLQDFHSAIYLSGLESILTADAQEQLERKKTKYPQKVNRAVSFNAIKNKALDLLFSDLESSQLLEQLTQLFLMNPTMEREGRNPPRKKSSSRKRLNYHKRQKKHCF